MSRIHKIASLALALALVPGLSLAAGSDGQARHAETADAQAHETHAPAATGDSALPLQRWLPDAPLSRGMQRTAPSPEGATMSAPSEVTP